MNQVAIEQALEVERFVARCRVEGEHGPVWNRTVDGARPRYSLYHGGAGIILFYLELHRATGEQRFLSEAAAAGDALLAHLADRAFLTIGLAEGWPGHLFVLDQLGRATGDRRFTDGARRCVERIRAQSVPLGAGVGWIEPMPFSDITGITGERELLDLSIGAAGAGVALLHAYRSGLDEGALDLAIATAERLLEMSIDSPDGPNWLMMADMPFPFTAPNFAHGAAGVAYFLADLAKETDNRRYLDTAVAAARYVQSRTTPTGDGCLVCHNEEQQPPTLFYLGVCHGPAGTGRLMYLLHEITGDDEWLDWIEANLRGLVATGAPEVRSAGLWNNVGQCCGDAGIGDYALWLYRATGRPHHLELARRIAAHLDSVADVTDGARSWQQAEHRARPDFVESQTGYMQGAAGIGSFLLHLATVDADEVVKISMPDVPFR